jgi:hypothetical protein
MKQVLNYAVGIAGALALAFSLGRGSAPSPALADAPAPRAPMAPSGTQNGRSFTYQGQLRKNGAPVNATCSATFKLFDAATGGVQLGTSVVSATLQVANGLFTIPLDYGWFMNGEARWIEMAIGCGEALSTLAPRTLLSPAPYAFALPGMRTLPAAPDGANPTINVIGGVVGVTGANTATANSFNSVIAGGISNTIGLPAGGGDGPYSAIGGGQSNQIRSDVSYGVIGGGFSNILGTNSDAGTVSGGADNVIADGVRYATVSGGLSNLVTGTARFGSIVGGTNGLSDHWGQQAYASGAFSRNGDAQASLFVLRGVSASGVTVTLGLDGAASVIKMASQRTLLAHVLIVARSENDLSGGYAGTFLIDRTGPSIYVNASVAASQIPVVAEDSQAVPWSCWIKPDNASVAALIQCAGASTQDVRFVATVRTSETQWNSGVTPALCASSMPDAKNCEAKP